MRWLQIGARVPHEMVEPVVELLQRYGGQRPVVEEPGGFNPDEGEGPDPDAQVLVRVYLPENRGTRARRARIEGGLRLLSMVRPIDILEPQSLGAEEWEEAWKAHFHLLHVGRRIVVRPPWQEYAAVEGEVVVTIDPGMAFGTGHHPTTRMCLEMMEPLVRPGGTVLDLGAGSGILSVAAVMLGAGRVLALDTDAQAVRVGRRNLRANGVGRRASFARGTLPHPEAQGVDLAMANVSAAVLLDRAGELFAALAPGGTLIASGLLDEREAEVAGRFQQVGFTQCEAHRVEDWVAFHLERPG